MKIIIRMAGKGQWSQARGPGVYPQFFLQFADQGGLWRLAGFDFAPRKLPEPSHRFAFGALGEEDAAVRIDKGDGGDKDDFGHER